jgi:hypothetical protein
MDLRVVVRFRKPDWACLPLRLFEPNGSRSTLAVAAMNANASRSSRSRDSSCCSSPRKWDKAAVLKFLRKTLKRHGPAQAIVTDRLRSYRAAMKQLGGHSTQEVGRWLNSRAENSHLLFRRRERVRSGCDE